MAVFREKPYGNYNYVIDLGTGDPGSVIAGFSEIILPEISIDVIEYRTGNDKENIKRKLPGLTHFTNLVLKRGIIGSLDLFEWLKQVQNSGPEAARNITIHLQNESRSENVLSWRVFNAFPVKYVFAPLNAKGNEVAVETFELAVEKIELE